MFGVFQERFVDWKGLLDICMLLREFRIEYDHRRPHSTFSRLTDRTPSILQD